MRFVLHLLAIASAAHAVAQVPYTRLIRAADEPGNWLTYSGNYNGHRHSTLAQIDRTNIGRLKPAWVYQTREVGKFETSPIVVDGVLYLTERPHIVTALDGRTGRPVWSYRRPAAEDVPACCGTPNRGLALLDDALYHLTFDAKIVALDLHSGKPRWEVVVADPKLGYSCTVAPLAVKDKIIVGVSGGEFGIRGFLDAYDAKTGERAWRFWTVPGPGEPGHETWAGQSWKTGGAPTWVTGSFDPELNLIYWGTGNPSPDYNGDDRAGDNLYACSLLALDADTGKLRWHFQFTPHDTHDWDSNHVPVLVDGTIDGRPRKLVVEANRNGFYYVLDRATGEFLRGAAYVKQTWADGLDERGRPRVRPGTEPTAEGTTVYPGNMGATNWFSPSHHPGTRLFYVQAVEDYAHVYHKLEQEHDLPHRFDGGVARAVSSDEAYGVVKALEVESGQLRWQFKLHSAARGGVLSTAGGLVFSGNAEGAFFALDAGTGKSLWHFQTGGQILANPVAFLVDGKQHVAIASGQAIFVFAL